MPSEAEDRDPMPDVQGVWDRFVAGIKLGPRLEAKAVGEGMIELRWGGQAHQFGAIVVADTRPKAIRGAFAEAAQADRRTLTLCPYADKDHLEASLATGAGVIDLCGNAAIEVENAWMIYRTGFRNRFRRPAGIRHVFAGAASLVPRLLLRVPSFANLQDMIAEATRRGGDLPKSTASKACFALDQATLLSRSGTRGPAGMRIRLLQPGAVLDALTQAYAPPKIGPKWSGKLPWPPGELEAKLVAWRESGLKNQIVRSGPDSVTAYAVIARSATPVFLCSDVDDLVRFLGPEAALTNRFPTAEFRQTRAPEVYFDPGPGLTSSPVQVYLDLMAGDKRERETAEQVRRVILRASDESGLTMDPLTQALAELLDALGPAARGVTLGGGFGLFLKRQHLERAGTRTLFSALPEARSTNDLDLFVRAEVITAAGPTAALRDAITGIGFAPIDSAKYFQWRRPVAVGGVEQDVKIDLLAGPLGIYEAVAKLKLPRVGPKGSGHGLHAHATPEAIDVDDARLAVELTAAPPRSVFVPEAFPYLLMKLRAFEDRRNDPAKDLGRHHAMDLYTIVGLMTEPEYGRAVESARLHADNLEVRRAAAVARDCFTALDAIGMLRLRAHRLFRPDLTLAEFAGVLREVFAEVPAP